MCLCACFVCLCVVVVSLEQIPLKQMLQCANMCILMSYQGRLPEDQGGQSVKADIALTSSQSGDDAALTSGDDDVKGFCGAVSR